MKKVVNADVYIVLFVSKYENRNKNMQITK